MQWFEEISEATDQEFREAVIPKPTDFSGSKYPTEISDLRVTGAPEFVEAVASRLKLLLEFEDETTRLEINLQRTENRDTGELTENYALYLSVAKRG
jgi:hypothetical protein